MTDHLDSGTPGESGGAGISRGQLLEVGAAGLAATLLAPEVAFGSSSTRQSSNPKKLLLRGGVVLTLDDAVGDFKQGDVLVERGKIVAVGASVPASGAQVVDCSGKIVIPGFVDTHRHMWQGLLRSAGPDDLLLDYLQAVLMGFALNLRPEEIHLGDLIAAYSAMNSGITTILDWSHINTTPEHTDAVIEALRESGIRAVYGYGPNFFHPNPATNPYPNDIFRLREQYFSSEDQLLTLALAAAGPQFAGVPFAVVEWNTARHPDIQARITTHVGVGADGPGLREAAVGRAGGRRASRPRARHDVHPLVHAHRRGAGSDRGHRRRASRSPARSRCRWAMGSRRSRRRSTAASRSASASTSRRTSRPTCSRRCGPASRSSVGSRTWSTSSTSRSPTRGWRSIARSC